MDPIWHYDAFLPECMPQYPLGKQRQNDDYLIHDLE